jgi:Ca-activated chloride channel homolog
MKASRVALLAAAQLCWGGLACQTAVAGGVSAAWSDLWRTPDQQGQALLDAGEPAAAAARFHDPRRRAYADLEAGRYPQAAKLLASFADPQSEYNLGNALAKAGQLQAALAAYDAALKQAPSDKDIRHNRDLVERALRQQRQSPQSRGQQGSRGSASSGQQQSAGQGGNSGSRQSGGSSQPSGAGGSRSAGGSQTASNGSQTGTGQSDKGGAQQSGQAGNPQDSGTPQSAGASGSGSSKEAPGQAQRDAALAAALARAQQQRATGNTSQAQGSQPGGTSESESKGAANQPDTGNLLAGGARTPQQKPETEKQLALDQWLRQIPDSPAGLLQRKFLIEHMMRQQNGGDTQEPGQ